jgi:uncharacterized membrane protein YccC
VLWGTLTSACTQCQTTSLTSNPSIRAMPYVQIGNQPPEAIATQAARSKRIPFLCLIWGAAFGVRLRNGPRDDSSRAPLGNMRRRDGNLTADAEAALFSLKTFAAAMISYYLSLRIGFSQPVWAITTVYLVSQPLAGMVLSKALFRLLGTFLGGAAAVVLLPAFVNEPLVLSFAMALWLGLCIYIAQLDRAPRSYTFLLAGYTAAIIGFPSVLAPGNIFNTAVLRVQEIGIGIVVTSLIHGVIFPRTVTKRLHQQIMAVVSSVEQGSYRALAGSRDAALDQERRRLASSINDIEQLSFHVAFDTARLLPRAAAIRVLQDQVSWLVPLSGVIEDRIAECRAQQGGLPADIAALITRIDGWFARDISSPARDQTAREIATEADKLERTISMEVAWRWRETLLVSLLSLLAELVLAHRLLRELQDHLLSGGLRGLSPEAARLISSATGRSLHRDHALALRSALGTMVAVLVVCVFWIATAWPTGSLAALLVGVACALFGGLPHPGIGIRRFFYGFLIGVVAAALLGFVIFPRVTDFVMLVGVLAPVLLFFGSMLARPVLAIFALGEVLGFLNIGGIASTYQSDFASFVNGAVAAAASVGTAVIVIDTFHVIGAEVAFARLFRAAFRDIAARADGRARDTLRWTRRIIDRMALIAVRAGPAGVHPALPPYDALVGMRIGYLAGELRAFSYTLLEGEGRKAIEDTLNSISAHFRSIVPTKRVPMGEAVLQAIDRAIFSFAIDPHPERRRRGAILLTGLRRSLFPQAGAFAVTQADAERPAFADHPTAALIHPGAAPPLPDKLP